MLAWSARERGILAASVDAACLMDNESALERQFALEEALNELQGALAAFGDRLALDPPAPIDWVEGTLEHREARRKALEALTALEFQQGQAPNESHNCAGVLGIAGTTADAAERVNAAKSVLRQALAAFRDGDDASGGRHNEEIREILKAYGLPRLVQRQAYRRFTILRDPPDRISFTWARTTDIKTVTVQEADQRLRRQGDDPGIEAQRARLAEIAPDERLAIVHQATPHPRANLRWHMSGGSVQRMVKARIPLLVVVDDPSHADRIRVRPLPEPVAHPARRRRGDRRIDPEVFLPAIHAHRYLRVDE